MLVRADKAERKRRGYGGACDCAPIIGRSKNTVISLSYVQLSRQYLLVSSISVSMDEGERATFQPLLPALGHGVCTQASMLICSAALLEHTKRSNKLPVLLLDILKRHGIVLCSFFQTWLP